MKDRDKKKKQLINEPESLREKTSGDQEPGGFVKALLNNTTPMTISTIKEDRYTDVNESFAIVTGLRREEIIGRTPVDIGYLTAEQRSIFLRELDRIGYVENLEMKIVTKAGRTRYESFNASKIQIADDLYLLTVITDITERRQAESALRESETKFRAIYEASNDAIMLLTEKGFIDCNERTLEMFGLKTREDFCTRHPSDLSPPVQPDGRDSRTAALEKIRKALREGKAHFEWVHRRTGGEDFFADVLLSSFPHQGETVLQATVRDISPRKAAEKELAASHQKISSTFDSSPVSAFAIDLDGKVTLWNRANEYFTGIPKDKVLGKPIDLKALFQRGRARPTLAEKVLKMTDEELMQKYARKGLRKSVIHPEAFESTGSIWIKGQEHIMAIQATRLRDSGGNIIGAIQCAQDITRQQKIEKSLALEHKRLSAILDGSPVSAFVIDRRHLVTEWNLANEYITGISKDAVLGKPIDLKRLFLNKAPSTLADLVLDLTDEEIAKRYSHKGVKKSAIHPEAFETTGTIRLNGDERFLSIQATRLRDAYGEIIGAIQCAQDITERKLLEDILRESEKKYRDIVMNSILEAYYECDLKGRITFANKAVLKILGYRHEEFIGMSFRKIMDKKMVKRAVRVFYDVYKSGKPATIDRGQLTARDGTEKTVECSVSLARDESGTPVGFRGIVRDITERVRLESGWKKSEFIINSASEIMSLVNRDYAYEAVNDAYCSAHKKTRGMIIGKSMAEVWGERKFHEVLKPLIDRCFQGETVHDESWVDFPGLERGYYIITYYPYSSGSGEVTHVAVVTHEITKRRRAEEKLKDYRDHLEELVNERTSELEAMNSQLFVKIAESKRAEEALKESESWYRTIFENTGTATVILDEKTTIVLANAEYEKLSGYAKDELEGKKSWTDFVVEEDLDRMMASHKQRRLDKDSAPKRYEFRFKDKAGSIRNIALSIDIIPGTSRSVASLLDITGFRQAEEQLKESEKKYRELYDFLPIPVYEMDMNANIVSANRAIYETFRGTEEDLKKGVKVWQIIAPEDLARAAENIQRLLKGEQTGGAEYTLMRLDGSSFQAALVSSAIMSGGRPVGLRGAVIDITDRRQAEEERVRMISDLQKALADVRKLSGLIPICASCKKIRDDKGFWNHLESYIRSHSEAEFSHGICPDCMRKIQTRLPG